MVKKLYSFGLPADVSTEDINDRAGELGIIPARLLDLAIRIVTRCSLYLLAYVAGLAKQHSRPQWAVIEQIIIDYRARRDAFANHHGAQPDIAFQTGPDGEAIQGEELYAILYRYYDRQFSPAEDNTDNTDK